MNTSVNIAGVTFKNPVMTASGTFGSGAEYSEFVDLNRLGAVVTKGVANVPWPGNPTPRIAEVYGGMLNAIGLQNPGIDLFIERDIPFLKHYDTKIIVNVCGKTTEDYCEVVERLADQPIDMMEINISCPNVKEGGIAFGQDAKAAATITKAVKAVAKQPVIMKLSPNVTDIAYMAQAVKIPVLGMGGVMTAEDAIELMLAGATAVSVGTANFANPKATEIIVDGIRQFMAEQGIDDINELIGAVHD